jgi:hypothetical protein
MRLAFIGRIEGIAPGPVLAQWERHVGFRQRL